MIRTDVIAAVAEYRYTRLAPASTLVTSPKWSIL